MSSLLSIPRELRDNILDYVIRSSRCAPSKPRHDACPSDDGRTTFPDTDRWAAPHFGRTIYFESTQDGFEPVFSSLLLTCHQLRAETLERAAKVQIPYELDLLIVNAESLWVTWLSMPLPQSPIMERLNINVRVAGALRNRCASHAHVLTDKQFAYLAQRLVMRILGRGSSGRISEANWEPAFTRTKREHYMYTTFEYDYVPHFAIRQLNVSFDENVLKEPNEQEASRGINFVEHNWGRTENDPWYIQQPYDFYAMFRIMLCNTIHSHGRQALPRYRIVFGTRIGSITISFAGKVREDWSRLSEEYEACAIRWRDEREASAVKKLIQLRKETGIHDDRGPMTHEEALKVPLFAHHAAYLRLSAQWKPRYFLETRWAFAKWDLWRTEEERKGVFPVSYFRPGPSTVVGEQEKKSTAL
jgi:hypothetical protein